MRGLDTTRNRAMVLAQFLRNAARDIRQVGAAADSEDSDTFDNALDSIDAIAEELETTAAGDGAGERTNADNGNDASAPDPAAAADGGHRG
jgi:hypothetical protein